MYSIKRMTGTCYEIESLILLKEKKNRIPNSILAIHAKKNRTKGTEVRTSGTVPLDFF